MVGYLYFDEHQPNPWDRPLKNFFNLSEIHSNRIYQGAPIHKSSHYYSGKANELYQRAQTAIQKAQSPKGLSSEDLFKTPRSQTDLLRMVLLVVHLGKPVDKLKEERISLECQHYELSLLLAASEQVKAKIEKPISSLKDVELQTSLKRECYNLSRCIDVTRYTINTLKQWQELPTFDTDKRGIDPFVCTLKSAIFFTAQRQLKLVASTLDMLIDEHAHFN